ncbi:MAG: 30S ribosomal protein S8 [Mycoplasmataceae bacterium]|jgi:small subunit ribosomal protein S8|nr:30S ribosomal protein S8 [Mycoplasmataceae bacterium]
MIIDPIADLINKVNNAIRAKLPSIEIQTSNLATSILEILKSEGYISNFTSKKAEGNKSFTTVLLKYKGKQNAITGLKQISKPGLKIYCECQKLPKVLNGLGIAVVTTSKGVMSDKKARIANCGGEILAYVW